MSTSRQKQAAAVNDSPSDVGGYPPLTAGTPPVDDWEVRLQAYESVFAGACGHTYGHYDIWPLDSPGLEYGKRSWRRRMATGQHESSR